MSFLTGLVIALGLIWLGSSIEHGLMAVARAFFGLHPDPDDKEGEE